jgi:hypothetical protein
VTTASRADAQGQVASVTGSGVPRGAASASDPLVLALARYVEALHRRYPGGPAELRRAGLAFRANMPAVFDATRPPAA